MSKVKNIYQNNNSVLTDAFDKLAAEIYIKKQKEGYKSFEICGTEPGVGSTTTAISVAVSMAKAGWKVLLVDCDLRKRASEKRLNDDEIDGIADMLDGSAKSSEIICKTNYDNLSYVSSGHASVNAISAVCSVSMKELMNDIKDQFDFIIVDVPSIASSMDAAVVATITDTVILVTSQEKGYRMKAIAEAEEKIKSVGAKISGIVVNHVEAGEYKRVVRNYDYFKKHKYITKKGNTDKTGVKKG
ncbi:MAG: CpsD/CapB family tyrosine-protein kinase [Lachnospiraceae bacterium]|nr:CpsD/CapB family tyrosine-protein kinase [Lachnospiraceae bacterium]